MFSSVLSLSAAVSPNVLDMTTDFAPLFAGLVVVLGLSILGIIGAIGFHDTRKAQPQVGKATTPSTPWPKAA